MPKGKANGLTEEQKKELKACNKCNRSFKRGRLEELIWNRKKFCSLKCYKAEKFKRRNRKRYHRRKNSFTHVPLSKGERMAYTGYKLIYVGNKKYKSAHRKAMEDYLGQELPRGIVVHHIDHNKLNNDVENLCLFTPEEHNIFHKHEEKSIADLKVKMKLGGD